MPFLGSRSNLEARAHMVDPTPDTDREGWLKLIKERRNPFFDVPPEEQFLWRYMDFTKFVSLLESASLFFPRVDILGDSLEGTVTQVTIDARRKMLGVAEEQIKRSMQEHSGRLPVELESRLFETDKVLADMLRWSRQWTYISCWHINDGESAAMWRLYAKSDEAIAVRTTLGRLEGCLDDHRGPPHGEPIIGKVKYMGSV